MNRHPPFGIKNSNKADLTNTVRASFVTRRPVKAAPLPIVDRFKTVFDRLALFTGLAYGLGYASRALHAWNYNFGALPGARFDYLVAGFLLCAPVLALAGTIWLIYRAGVRINKWAERNPPKAALVVKRIVSPAVTFSMLAFMGIWFVPDAYVARFTMTLLVVMFLGLVAGGVLMPGVSAKASSDASFMQRSIDWLGLGVAYVVTAYFGFLLILAFVLATLWGALVIARIPQEFGGVRPKCGVLDIKLKEVSPQLASILVPSHTTQSVADVVVRSKPLEVYSTSGPWLIKAQDANAAPKLKSIRLDSNAVRSVEWMADIGCSVLMSEITGRVHQGPRQHVSLLMPSTSVARGDSSSQFVHSVRVFAPNGPGETRTVKVK